MQILRLPIRPSKSETLRKGPAICSTCSLGDSDACQSLRTRFVGERIGVQEASSPLQAAALS